MAFLKKLRGVKGALGRVGRKADGDAAPPAEDPALHPRQGAGHARLVPVDAILAGRVGRQSSKQMIRFLVSRYATQPRLARRQGRGPGRLPGCRALPPRRCTARITTDPRDLPRPKGATATVGLLMLRVLHPGGGHRALRRRDPRLRGAGASPSCPPLPGAWTAAPRSTPIMQGQGRCAGVADRLQPCRRPRLQRQRRPRSQRLPALDVPYIAAHPLEFQTLSANGQPRAAALARSKPPC